MSSSVGFPDLTNATNFKRTPLSYKILQSSFVSQIQYNNELILLLAQNTNSLGAIPADVKTQIAEIVVNTNTMIASFAVAANLTNDSQAAELGFYYPVYTNINTGAYIRVGDDIDHSDFSGLNASSTDANIRNFTTAFNEALTNLQY